MSVSLIFKKYASSGYFSTRSLSILLAFAKDTNVHTNSENIIVFKSSHISSLLTSLILFHQVEQNLVLFYIFASNLHALFI